MEAERRNQWLLGGLVLTLVVVAGRAWTTSDLPLPPPTAAPARIPAGPGHRGAASAETGPEVHLQALEAGRPTPTHGTRNLFVFKPKPLPPPPPPPPRVAVAAPVAPAMPAGPPPPPPITLKFIGIVEVPGRSQKIAVLSEGRGTDPIYGKEGDIIDGRYRLVRIGAESVEIMYLDGRGRQTIRLSGA
jgi:hypothetical protein